MTDALKVSMLHHVRYEIEHCMIIPKWRAEAHFTQEAIFLSFFVHARGLIHFFERTRTAESADDVYSSDFDFATATIPIPPEDRLRFGKDMMHITTKRERHTGQTKAWPILSTYTAIKPIATRFSAHVLSSYGPKLSAPEHDAWSKLVSSLEASGDKLIVVDEAPNQHLTANSGQLTLPSVADLKRSASSSMLPPNIIDQIQTSLQAAAAGLLPFALKPDRTHAFKLALGRLGADALGFEVCSSSWPTDQKWEKAWLFDLAWYRGDGQIIALPLVMECEWLEDDYSLREDFEKLIIAKADIKVMIFQSPDAAHREQSIRRMKEGIDKFALTTATERYVFACYNVAAPSFHFEAHQKKPNKEE